MSLNTRSARAKRDSYQRRKREQELRLAAAQKYHDGHGPHAPHPNGRVPLRPLPRRTRARWSGP
jgi:hypothetical protein